MHTYTYPDIPLVTFEAFHAGTLVIILEVLARATVLAGRRQALVDVLLAAVARIACTATHIHLHIHWLALRTDLHICDVLLLTGPAIALVRSGHVDAYSVITYFRHYCTFVYIQFTKTP